MSMTVDEVRAWLGQFDGQRLVGIDEGGLTLIVVDDETLGMAIQPQLEVGGLSDDDDTFADCVYHDPLP